MLRTMENLSACVAMRGKFSEISMPGTLVLMGLNGPANLDGRVGLHIPGVQLGGSADQHQEDAVDVFLRIGGALRFETEELGAAPGRASKASRRAGNPCGAGRHKTQRDDRNLGVSFGGGPPGGRGLVVPDSISMPSCAARE